MRTLTLILLFNFFATLAFSQDWVVPAERKGKLSPFRFTEETKKEGERLYNLNCKSCHGTPSKGDYLSTLNPVPGDPATDKIQHNLDGEIFYKLTTGRGQMPAFRDVLSATDMWNIISFLRSFRKDYVQSVSPVIKSSAYPDAEISIALAPSEKGDAIMMKVTAKSEKEVVPVTDAGVRLFVKRYFGQIELGDDVTTDKTGVAVFTVPDGFPADTGGRLHVSAKFADEEVFGAAAKDTMITAGTKTIPVSLTAKRAMWNTVRKAPVWIILTYSLGVLAVWGFIFVVMLLLREIFIIGEHVEKINGREEKQV
jgi:hypothetical protein